MAGGIRDTDGIDEGAPVSAVLSAQYVGVLHGRGEKLLNLQMLIFPMVEIQFYTM